MTSATCSPFRRMALGALLLPALLATSPAPAVVTVGSMVVIGYTDNNVENSLGDDEIAFLLLNPIQAGEVLYLTNNGWINDTSSRAFNGADVSGATGKGVEQLTKLTINSDLGVGTIIKTSGNLAGAITWNNPALIPTGNGVNTDTFSALDLTNDGATYGDQIYIFQASTSTNPLLNPNRFIHAFHQGDLNVAEGGFFNTYLGGVGGALPNGKVAPLANGSPYNTVPTVDLASDDADSTNDYTAFQLDPFSSFWNGTYHINMSSTEIVDLNTNGGTREQWLIALGNSGNWISDTSLNFGSGFVGLVPEPSRALLLISGLIPMMLRRRRVG